MSGSMSMVLSDAAVVADHSAASGKRSFTSIPVVNISGLYSADLSERLAVAGQLAQAARDVGFIYIEGHSIPHSRMDALLLAAQQFFAQPLATKLNSYIGYSRNHSGYVPEGEEQFYAPSGAAAMVDRKESWDCGFELEDPRYCRPMLGQNQWPELPGFRQAVMAYYNEALALGRILFRGFALALGLPETFFDGALQAPPSQLRLVHYPYDGDASDRVGIGAHTDYECFTLLLPTADGLEVLNGDGQWIDAPVIPGCLVVNIGDMLEVLSNGRFVATSHRVRKVAQERYSFPLFCSLDYDTCVAPVLPPLPGTSPERYQPLICGDHLYAQTIRTFRYLRQKVAAGELGMPDQARELASFGQYRAVLDLAAGESL